MSYYFDVTQDDRFGFCSKLRMLNAFMNYYERNNEVVYPRLKFNNIDIWKEYFVSEFDYSVYFSSKELYYHQLKEPECSTNFMKHIRFNQHILNRADTLYQSIGSPKIVFYTRETDKIDGHDHAISPIIYSKLISDLNLTDPILVISDCDYTINYLKTNHKNVISTSHHKSKNFMPLHRFLNNKFNFNKSIDPKILFDELIMDILLMSKSNTIFYGTWSGVLSMMDCLFDDYTRPKKLSIKSTLDTHTQEILSYYKKRETFLWKIIEDYYYGSVTTSGNNDEELFK